MTVVEVAIVAPITFLLLIGLLVGSLGVFRYQQVSRLARDAARWASTHGTGYASDAKTTAATATDIYNAAIAPNAVGLDLTKLTYTVTWNTSNAPSRAVTVNNSTVNIANTVSVTLTYQWAPEALLGAGTLSSTSVCPMTN
jgi:Flp pilus assembly protein TadG